MKMRSFLHVVLWGILVFTSAAPPASAAPNPLTATVEELESGGVRITLSGTTTMESYGEFSLTNFDLSGPTPPQSAPGDATIALPPGLLLTVTAEAPVVTELQVTTLHFTGGYWNLGGFESGWLTPDDPITGSGSVELPDLPFSHFVAGSFVVRKNAAPEQAGPQGEFFEMTYEVIALPDIIATAGPGALVVVEGPPPFSALPVGARSGGKRIRVKNVGGGQASGLSVSVAGRNARDFRVSGPRLGSLAPNTSALYRVSFRPSREGVRRAKVVVNSSAPEATAPLRGVGLGSAIHSPRFPRGT